MKWIIEGTKDGRLNFGDYNRAKFIKYLAEHGPIRLELKPMTPESREQRGFYFGAVLRLWAFLDGKDYKDPEVIEMLHEIAKVEFNGQMIKVAGKVRKVGKSTKGKLNQGYLDRLIDYLEEQYGIDRTKVLDPEDYKYFRDQIYSTNTQYDDYISYMLALGKLK
jgi:hypothetical protein